MIPEAQTLLRDFFEKAEQFCTPNSIHLKQTSLCNSEHPLVQNISQQLFTGLNSSEQKAEKAYQFIRNKIPYALDHWGTSASQTLEKSQGMCFNKSNLMIALLRSEKIPCLYSAIWISKEAFSWMRETALYEKISPETVHLYVEVYLGQKSGWRRYVDTSMDPLLRQALEKKGHHPFEHIMTDRPVERFSTPEEVLIWRKNPPPSPLPIREGVGGGLGFENSITEDEIKEVNELMRRLRADLPHPLLCPPEADPPRLLEDKEGSKGR